MGWLVEVVTVIAGAVVSLGILYFMLGGSRRNRDDN
jgi:hypothetical protein